MIEVSKDQSVQRLVIKNVTVLTMNKQKEIIEKAYVIVEKDRIVKIATEISQEDLLEAKIVDGKEGILMPGMVNCHTHAAMIPFRSLADDCADRLKKYIFPLEQKLVDKELVYIGSKYGIAEMLLGGVTTFADMYYFEDEVAKAAKELHIRGVLCETVVDFAAPDSKEPFGGIAYAQTFIEKWQEDALITPGIAPHALYTNTAESLKACEALATKYQAPYMMHVAEMDYEVKESYQKYGLSPVAYLDQIGVLSSKFISAHTILVDEEDIKILKKNDVGVAHNIGANAKGAKGVMPINKMMQEGLKIGLGTDGPMSGNTLDIFTQMSLVAKIHKLSQHDRSLMPARDIVEMATLGGAKVLGLEEIGSIEVGKKADLVLIETESVNMQPIYDYYATLVYSANASNVDTVIINGEIVVENKKLVKQDLKSLQQELIRIKQKVLKSC